MLTPVSCSLRPAEKFKPRFVVGDGPGAIADLALSRAEFVEQTFQTRNVQQVEIDKVGPEWSKIRMVVSGKPYVTKASLGVDLLERLFPAMFPQGA